MTSPPERTGPLDPTDCRAWLFDLDGVLTRTADLHAAAWKSAFDGFLAARTSPAPGTPSSGFDPVEDYLRYVDGRPRTDGVRTFLASRGITLPEGEADDPPTAQTVMGVANAKNTLFQELLETGRVAVYDGAVELVRLLKARGVPVAVVSASENTPAVLRAAGIAGLFDACVDGTVVKERRLAGKPAPDSYLEAAAMLGIDPALAAIVEDAQAGVEAGRSGHFGLVVGVDHTGQADALRSHGADLVVGDLGELLPGFLGPAGGTGRALT
jgi:beta-phosphoglucomutase family hydrolase